MKVEDMPTWNELIDGKRKKSAAEIVVLNCIATISSHPNYQHMTPWEIYDLEVKNAIEIFA
jgi:hypothetical protein